MTLVKKNGDINKTKAIDFINTELNLQLNDFNTTCKKLDEKNEWWLEIDNSKFEMDYHLLLVDIDERCIHYFEIPAKKITEPEEKFAQQNKKNNKIKSHIHLNKDNNPDFSNHYRGIQFSFGDYYVERVPIPETDVDQEQHQDNKKHPPEKNQKRVILISKESGAKRIDKSISESSLVIAQRCEKLVKKINKIKIIFNKENTEEWLYIREPVKSEADFFMFRNKLCILVKEDTRYKNPDFKPGKRNGPYYYDRFPDNARRIKLFKEDVENIRNYEGHKKDNEEKKLKYIEVCKKYLDLKREPVEKEEFMKFQINILSEFEVSLEELLDILLKKDKNK